MPTIRIQDKNNNITLSRGLICIIYAKNRPIGWYFCYFICSSFVLRQIKNLRAPSIKPLKIPFQRNLQIQNRPSRSRDIRPTRTGTLRKVPLKWILSALGHLLRIYKVSVVTVRTPLRHTFDEEAFKTHSKALWRIFKLLEAPKTRLRPWSGALRANPATSGRVQRISINGKWPIKA